MFTHTVAQPYDKIGFGARTEGYEPNIEGAFIFTPAWAIERTWRHIFPCISFKRARLGKLPPQFVKGCRIVFDVAHRLCAVNSAVVSAIYTLLPPFAEQIRCVLPCAARW